MKCDQLYYTSSTTGTRGGAGFQINAHSGTLEQDIQREVEAYSLYTPPSNCPRTPETPEDFASFPVSYRYRRFAGRRAGLSRSLYLGKDYNSVRYGNFFTHILLAPENEDFQQLQDPLLMAKLDLWASVASPTVQLPDCDLPLPDPQLGSDELRSLYAHPRFGDLVSFCLAGLADRKCTVIVDSQANTARWISAVLRVLPSGIRRQISFSTYEYSPQNLDYNLCGTTLDSSFDFSEAAFRFNFYIMDFSSDRYSPSLEQGRFAKLITRLGSSGGPQSLSSFLAFLESVKRDPDPAQLNSLAELWSILNDKDSGASMLRAMQLMKEFHYKPPEEMVLGMQNWALSHPQMDSAELKSFWDYIFDGFIASEGHSPRILSWSYTLLVVMLKHFPIADQTGILRLLTLIQRHGGLLQLESYDRLVSELKAQLQTSGPDRFFLLKVCRELRLSEHPDLQPHLQAALMERIQGRPLDEEGFELLSSSLQEAVPYVENVILELFSAATPQRGQIPLLMKLISNPELKSALKEMLQGRNKAEVWESIELYELFSQPQWEEPAGRWWMVNRLAPNKMHLHDRFWSVAQAIHPSWAPLDFLVKDPALIRHTSFIKAFWDTISAYNPLSSYEKKTADLLESLAAFYSAQAKATGLSRESLDLGGFISAYREIFYHAEASSLAAVKSVLAFIPAEYASYKTALGIQLIKKLNTPSRKGSDWESLLAVIYPAAPKAISTLLERESTLLKEFPAVFWVGIIRLAVSQGMSFPEELHRLIKQSVKNLPESKLQDIMDRLKDRPQLADYIQGRRPESVIQKFLGIFRK